MDTYKSIQKKLAQFSKKYYTNQLLKGAIFFFSLGFIYLFCILFIEHFLWLQPTARTGLFVLFILVELFLLVRFIAIPFSKLIGLRNGISLEQASKIIGNHFPEVQDKLLNVLQLKQYNEQSDLLIASIQQKANELQPIPFVKAINFKENIHYLKYALIPICIWGIILFMGIHKEITNSFQRVVDYKTAYSPPAPFAFSVENKSLYVVQGKPITIKLKTTGKVTPETVKIFFKNQQYYLQNNGNSTFQYTFLEVNKSIPFYVEANGIRSQNYTVQVIPAPTIQDVSMQLQYPAYIGKKNEWIKSTGNVTAPQGTQITWNVKTNQTKTVDFISAEKRTSFKEKASNNFVFSKRIIRPINYQIKSSNNNLRDYESLPFSINIIKDEFPSITIQSTMDSISYGKAQFAGQISDDYGIRSLQIVYYNDENPTLQKIVNLPVNKENIQTFYYEFPDNLELETGINYNFFFQVFDNDAVNGSKKETSKTFRYRKKTTQEIDQQLLQEQKETIQNLETTLQKQEKEKKALQKMQFDLQNKKKMQWNDKKKVQDFVKRQEQYQKMMQRQTEKLQENFEDKKEKEPSLQEKKEALKNRIAELKKLDKQEKLLKEIQKMAEKLNKEDLLKKAKELAQQNKQQERSLKRILELTKRFYVEQKTMQIAEKLENLAKKQEDLQQKNDSVLAPQKEIKKAFSEIEKELEELAKENEKLKEPMELPDTEDEKEEINTELNETEKSLEEKNTSKAKQQQKKAGKKMRGMSAKMKSAMAAMQGQSIEENMDDLRKILENLVTFSFQQENLMNGFESIAVGHPDFGKKLKKQNEIKTYFEHIDDSLYVLSMRVPSLSTKIKENLSSAHYNLEQSLENFSENRFSNGVSNQRYVMTAANSLADYLSNILNNMKNSMSMNPGQGKKSDFNLPDLIQKQKGLGEKMEKGMQKESGKEKGEKGEKKSGDQGGKEGEGKEQGKSGKGNKEGNSGEKKRNGENEDLNGELYQIYKEQSQLRQALQEAIKGSEKAGKGNAAAKKVLKTMEELEQEILEKGFNGGTLRKMQLLNYELLKLDKAALQQGKEKQRKATTNTENYEKRKGKALQFKKQFYNRTEILNRQSLPLQENYKKKVQEYFKKN